MQKGYCSCPCLSVRLLSHISPLEDLFVLKVLSRTQWAKEVKILWGFLWNNSIIEIKNSHHWKAICTCTAGGKHACGVVDHVVALRVLHCIVHSLRGHTYSQTFPAKSKHAHYKHIVFTTWCWGFCTLMHSLACAHHIHKHLAKYP